MVADIRSDETSTCSSTFGLSLGSSTRTTSFPLSGCGRPSGRSPFTSTSTPSSQSSRAGGRPLAGGSNASTPPCTAAVPEGRPGLLGSTLTIVVPKDIGPAPRTLERVVGRQPRFRLNKRGDRAEKGYQTVVRGRSSERKGRPACATQPNTSS